MLLDDIYVMWIPILVIALMAALGWWRGVYRELIVSAAIVLSALIALQWATQDRWARDLSTTFSGLGPGEWQFFLTLVLVGLIVTVVGYGLGGLYARRGLSSTTRTFGALLGLANGAALTGWILRAAYEGLVDKAESSAVYQNPISLSLMVWAGWFPVVLAVLGAVAALVYSLRGDNAESVTGVSNAGAHMAQPQAATSYAPSLPQLYQPSTTPPAQARVEHYAGHPADATATVYMPIREQSAMAPTVANAIPHYGPMTSETTAETAQSLGSVPARPVGGGNSDAVQTVDTFHDALKTSPASTSEPSQSTPHTPPFGYDLSALWGKDEDSSSTTTSTSASDNQPIALREREPDPPATDTSTATERRCRNCGNLLPPGAVFCTECGTRAPESV